MWAGGKQGGLAAEWSGVSVAASPPHSPMMISQDDHPGSRGAAVHGQPSATLGTICSTRPTALEATVPGGKPASHIRRAGLVVQGLASLSSSSLEHSTHTSTCRECSRLIQQTYDWPSRCCGVEHTGKPRLPLRWKNSFLPLPVKRLPKTPSPQIGPLMAEFNTQKPINWKRSRTTHKGFHSQSPGSIPGRGTKHLKSYTACPPPKKVKKESSPGKWKAVENYGYYFNY